MTIRKEILDELIRYYKNPEDLLFIIQRRSSKSIIFQGTIPHKTLIGYHFSIRFPTIFNLSLFVKFSGKRRFFQLGISNRASSLTAWFINQAYFYILVTVNNNKLTLLEKFNNSAVF